MAAKKKSASRKAAGKKAAKTRKARAAGKKAATTRKRPAAAKKAAATRRARPAALPPAVAQLDQRIAILRDNLRGLTEQAAASSGASTEELLSDRIADHETQLRLLIKERDALVRRGS